MVEKITETWEALLTAALFAAIGAVIGIGILLTSGEKLVARIVIGRAIVHGGLAMAAGTVLIWFPSLSLVGQIGVAAILSSLGASFLERLFSRVVSGAAEKLGEAKDE